ncbi:MAG: hypothetical protein OXE78_01520 [Gammaproteobacteria bacterium]|nr:hypothetical protein [Gammaproteobacteria bacterium]MCY4358053.1 hypothetical protein [Gammaproteobacteria bacterium]
MASKAADILANWLEQDAEAFERNLLKDLTERLKSIQQEVVPINDIPRPTFKLAMSFLKEWDLALRKGEEYFGSIQMRDWPVMARTIAENVRKGSLPNDQLILDNFVRKRKSLPWRDLMTLFGKSN